MPKARKKSKKGRNKDGTFKKGHKLSRGSRNRKSPKRRANARKKKPKGRRRNKARRISGNPLRYVKTTASSHSRHFGSAPAVSSTPRQPNHSKAIIADNPTELTRLTSPKEIEQLYDALEPVPQRVYNYAKQKLEEAAIDAAKSALKSRAPNFQSWFDQFFDIGNPRHADEL